MLSQTAEQRAGYDKQIEEIMKGLVRDTIDVHMHRFGGLIERKLGLTGDDLRNDVREQVWKALLTFRNDGKVKLRTYVNRLIEYRFRVLLKQSGLKKYNSLEYFACVFTSTVVDQDHFVTEETGESFFERRTELKKDLAYLTTPDRAILAGLSLGHSIAELCEMTKRPRPEIIAAIGRIDLLLKKRREAV